MFLDLFLSSYNDFRKRKYPWSNRRMVVYGRSRVEIGYVYSEALDAPSPHRGCG